MIVKDPNKQILRLYDIPDNTFESEDDSEESEEGRLEVCSRILLVDMSWVYWALTGSLRQSQINNKYWIGIHILLFFVLDCPYF